MKIGNGEYRFIEFLERSNRIAINFGNLSKDFIFELLLFLF